MANNVNKMYEARVYIAGISFLGLAEEASIPGLTASVVAHETIGTSGSFNIPTGFDAMEARFKWKGWDKVIFQYTGDLLTLRDIQVRSVIEKYSGTATISRIGVVAFMKGRFRNTPNADFTPKTDVDSESIFDVQYIRIEIDGANMLEYDAVNYIYKVGGTDLLAEKNSLLGG